LQRTAERAITGSADLRQLAGIDFGLKVDHHGMPRRWKKQARGISHPLRPSCLDFRRRVNH
jgi:hypothetical protein